MPFSNVNQTKILLKTLYQMRIGAGLTQRELAERLNLPQSTISKVESGIRKVDIIELRNWCLAAGFSLPDFVEQFEKNINEEG